MLLAAGVRERRGSAVCENAQPLRAGRGITQTARSRAPTGQSVNPEGVGRVGNASYGSSMARWLSLLVALTAFTVDARAAPPSSSSEVTFEEALGLAEQLPVLVAGRVAAQQERALPLQLPWQPLLITATPQLRIAPEDARGVEGGLAVQQYIPLGDVRGAKREVLERQADARAAAVAASTLERKLSVAAAWIVTWRARERRAVADREYDLAREILGITERGRAAGVFTAPEVADAKTFMAEVDLRRTDAEGELAQAGFELAKAMGRTGKVEPARALPAAPLPASDVATELVARAATLPRVAAKRLVARVERARAAEERSTRRAQLVVGAEAFRDEPGGFVAGITLGVALPHDRGEREAREAELASRIAEAEASQLSVEAVSQLESALHEVAHTEEVLVKLRDQLVPAADEAATQRQRALEVGEGTLVELLMARRTALQARARLTDARAAHAWARIEAWLLLESTTGGS